MMPLDDSWARKSGAFAPRQHKRAVVYTAPVGDTAAVQPPPEDAEVTACFAPLRASLAGATSGQHLRVDCKLIG